MSDLRTISESSISKMGQEKEEGHGKRKRLNRPVSACETCRKLKTRCEIVSAKKGCRRCMLLGIGCDLPGADNRIASDDRTSIDGVHTRLARLEKCLNEKQNEFSGGIESRLACLERSIEELSCLFRGPTRPQGLPRQDTHTPRSTTSVESNDNPATSITRPVQLVRNLQTQFFGPKRDFSDEVFAVGSVVTAGIIRLSLARHLIQIFVKHYGLWISVNHVDDFPPDLEQHYPLLFSTACLLASRFVPSIGRTDEHEMYLMIRRLAASVVLRPPPLHCEDLQGLLLLSMFSPTIQSAMPIDSWSMSALGINHATLHLNDPDNILVRSESGDMLLRKLRIWNALCLTHIQFSIGNGRQSIVQQKFVDYCYEILELPDSSFEDARLSAEVLLYWKTAHLLNHGNKLWEGENAEFDELLEWKASWERVFDNPLSINLRLSYMFCHLLLYRVSLRAQAPSIVFKEAALRVSRDILEKFQELDFTVILDLPDYYFFIVIYAALTLCKFIVSDPLIAMTQEWLEDLAPNEEHIAFRFGTVLREIRQKAAAVGTPMDRIDDPDGLSSTSNEHYAWDVFMAGFCPQNIGEFV